MDTNRNSNQVGGSGCVSRSFHDDVRSARAVQHASRVQRRAEEAERVARGERACGHTDDTWAHACGHCREWYASH